ncbi:MAG: cupin domain-containing protein [Alphaproteobacteria bacterium]|nr:cupin domain-containing protein [Alphaproteobacteria bacterium]
MDDLLLPGRRDLLLAPLLTALPLALVGESARADKLNPDWTIVRLPDQIKWQSSSTFPPNSVEQAPLFGATTESGLYFVLVKWHPGYMSAPHTYVTDRLCVVVSGTWWVNSGADFEPENTVPAPAGSFIRRVAGTPHYDGVKADGKEPAVIAICGTGPVGLQWLDPSKPGWRKV